MIIPATGTRRYRPTGSKVPHCIQSKVDAREDQQGTTVLVSKIIDIRQDLRFTASDYAEVVNPHSKPVRLPLSIPIETVSALGTNISSSPTTSTPPHLPEGSLRFLKDYSTREISVLDRHNKDSERRTSGRYTLNSHHPSKVRAITVTRSPSKMIILEGNSKSSEIYTHPSPPRLQSA